MEAGLIVPALAVTAANGLLTALDGAVADSPRRRAAMGTLWLLSAVLACIKDAMVPDPRFSILVAVIAVNVGAMVGTWFRPGLVMDLALPERTVSDRGLMRRGRWGQIFGLAGGFAYLAWTYR